VIGALFHRHRMIPTRAQAIEIANPLNPNTSIRGTAALLLCGCGAFQVTVMPGKWTVQDLLGVSASAAVDKLLQGVRHE